MSAAFGVADAARAQLPQIASIYNEVIRSTTALYSEREVTLADREAWFAAKAAAAFPVLVANNESGVLGFGTFGEFRSAPGYRFSVEHSVHGRADCRGRGVGRALLLALIERAKTLNKHVMIGAIDADNAISIRLHERLGFKVVGHFHEVGFKFGRWLDLKFLQRLI